MSRVTVIDDDQDVLDTFHELFEAYGYEVAARTAPISRIEELVALQPDLVVIDLRLVLEREELSGLQTIHAARTSPELREVPIIVCTADVIGLQAAWPAIMSRGDVHQLTKPFDLRTFERVVAMATGSAPQFEGLVGRDGMVGAQSDATEHEA